MVSDFEITRELVDKLLEENENNQTKVAHILTEMSGREVSRRKVNYYHHSTTNKDTRLPYRKALDLMPFIGMTRTFSKTKHFQRLQYHLEFMITDGVGMSAEKRRSLVSLYLKLTEFDLVQVFDPAIKPHPGVITGGWDYVPRDRRPVEQGGDHDLIIKANKYTPLSDESLELWRLPVRESWPSV